MAGTDTAGGPLIEFDAIGTRWRIRTPEPVPAALLQEVHRCIADFDVVWSRFRPDSLVRAVAAAPSGGRFVLPPDARVLLDLYDLADETTGGAVNPLVGEGLERLGYDAALSLRPDPRGPAAPPPRWRDAVRREGDALITAGPLLIDVGAAGKGRLVDLVGDVLTGGGIRSFVIDAGGDLLVRALPVRIGLEDPADHDAAIGVLELEDGAVCGSATDRRRWGPGLHHVLDGRTGRPSDAVAATWATARTAAAADIAATALFFAPAGAVARAFAAHGARLFPDRRVETSTGFPGELFLASPAAALPAGRTRSIPIPVP